MKNYYKSVLFIIALISSQFIMAQGTVPAGSGTIGDPYLIASLDNPEYISLNTGTWGSAVYMKQTANIDATATLGWNSNTGFSPIGISSSTPFQGQYDGQGYTISNLFINRASSWSQGLFGYGLGATIQNIVLSDVDINGKGGVGGLVGKAENATITLCKVSGTVKVQAPA